MNYSKKGNWYWCTYVYLYISRDTGVTNYLLQQPVDFFSPKYLYSTFWADDSSRGVFFFSWDLSTWGSALLLFSIIQSSISLAFANGDFFLGCKIPCFRARVSLEWIHTCNSNEWYSLQSHWEEIWNSLWEFACTLTGVPRQIFTVISLKMLNSPLFIGLLHYVAAILERGSWTDHWCSQPSMRSVDSPSYSMIERNSEWLGDWKSSSDNFSPDFRDNFHLHVYWSFLIDIKTWWRNISPMIMLNCMRYIHTYGMNGRFILLIQVLLFCMCQMQSYSCQPRSYIWDWGNEALSNKLLLQFSWMVYGKLTVD